MVLTTTETGKSNAVRTFTVPVASYTKLMLHMDGTNGTTIFTDSETIPKTVTTYGNANISTAQSKFGAASGSMDIVPKDNLPF